MESVTLAMKFLLPLYIIILSHIGFSQKESNIWCFGDSCAIDFNSGSPVFYPNTLVDVHEGSASICDESGNLLLYGNGTVLFKGNNSPELSQTLNGQSTSTQGVLFVQRPRSQTRHFIFTAGFQAAIWAGIEFSEYEIDPITLTGNFVSASPFVLQVPSSEKLISVLSGNRIDKWVITHDVGGSNIWRTFKISKNGVDTIPVLSSSGWSFPSSGLCGIGELAVSPNLSKLAYASSVCMKAQILDFDNCSGEISNPITLPVDTVITTYEGIYGCEFSPDGNCLYYSFSGSEWDNIPSKIYQFDLSSNNPSLIQNSMTLIYEGPEEIGQLKAGPDGKIYAAQFDNSYLGVINSPNTVGVSCDYQSSVFYLDGFKSKWGLPNINTISSRIVSPKGVCKDKLTEFILSDSVGIDSIQWEIINQNSSIIYAENNYQLHYTFIQTGVYEIQAILYTKCGIDTLFKSVNVENFTPNIYILNNPPCYGESISIEIESFEEFTVNGILYQSSASIPINDDTSLSIIVQSETGCLYDTIAFIFPELCLEIPNVITVNGDGVNDLFNLNFPYVSCRIINRWGNLVFESFDNTNFWDGTDKNGRALSEGTYFYIIDVGNNKHKGHIQLIR